MKNYDTLIIGPVSLDCNIDHLENSRHEFGGAVVQSGFAASKSGHMAAVFTKFNPRDAGVEDFFKDLKADVFWKESAKTTSIRNKYFTADKEKRECRALSICDPFMPDEIPDVDTKIYHLAGLISGDFSNEFIYSLSKRGKKLALDVQCMLRHALPDGTMVFRDWDGKEEYMKYIDFLKTDAAEAEILTGERDRKKAAKILYNHGAKEIMITHNTEVLIYDGKETYTCPIRSRNLSGRTGRGDTCFSGYILERLTRGIPESLLFATALVSLKMEKPGPFKGSRADVKDYISKFYPDYQFQGRVLNAKE
jgi:sugar/nucleoside kinase (ribokinase family)